MENESNDDEMEKFEMEIEEEKPVSKKKKHKKKKIYVIFFFNCFKFNLGYYYILYC